MTSGSPVGGKQSTPLSPWRSTPETRWGALRMRLNTYYKFIITIIYLKKVNYEYKDTPTGRRYRDYSADAFRGGFGFA